jgi:hypothetical protein
VEAVGYVTTVIVLIFVCGAGLAAMASFFQRKKKKPPKLAGAAIPETGDGLDIGKRYDIVYSAGEYGSHVGATLHAVRIVGYVGRDDNEASKMYMWWRWLVVEFPDGRRAYLMPRSIVSLQESAPAGRPDA